MKRLGFLLMIVALWGCTKKAMDTVPVQAGTSSNMAPAIHLNDSVTYLALGDSYTYGAGVPLAGSYPYQLAAKLAAQGYLPGEPRVVAFQGWTAEDLLNGIQSANIIPKFDIVTLLVGVNDQVKGTDMAAYTARFDQLLTKAIAFAHGYPGRVFVISIPDWSVTPFAAGMDRSAIKAGVTAFNMINEAESKKSGAQYLDITNLSEMAATDPSLTSADGLHPSAKAYSLWVGQVYGNITASFK
jgi:lysophospholipase L1-like esterase